MSTILGIERHVGAWWIGFAFMMGACLISLYSIRGHFLYNCNPLYKKFTIYIILMVTIYAIVAWLGLIDKSHTFAYDVGRECYEAFAIYAFYSFLVSYVATENGKTEDHDKFIKKLSQQVDPHPETTNHLFPVKYVLKKWKLGREIIVWTFCGVGQYVFVKLLSALFIVVLSIANSYNPGHIASNDGYVYITILMCVSQTWAMYCLVVFYYTFKEKLSPMHPALKFACIKLVVFFTFWQGFICAILSKYGYITDTETYTTEQVSEGVQDFLICIEMFAFSILQLYAFPAMEFYDANHITSKYETWVDHLLALLWPVHHDDKSSAIFNVTPESQRASPLENRDVGSKEINACGNVDLEAQLGLDDPFANALHS